MSSIFSKFCRKLTSDRLKNLSNRSLTLKTSDFFYIYLLFYNFPIFLQKFFLIQHFSHKKAKSLILVYKNHLQMQDIQKRDLLPVFQKKVPIILDDNHQKSSLALQIANNLLDPCKTILRTFCLVVFQSLLDRNNDRLIRSTQEYRIALVCKRDRIARTQGYL